VSVAKTEDPESRVNHVLHFSPRGEDVREDPVTQPVEDREEALVGGLAGTRLIAGRGRIARGWTLGNGLSQSPCRDEVALRKKRDEVAVAAPRRVAEPRRDEVARRDLGKRVFIRKRLEPRFVEDAPQHEDQHSEDQQSPGATLRFPPRKRRHAPHAAHRSV